MFLPASGIKLDHNTEFGRIYSTIINKETLGVNLFGGAQKAGLASINYTHIGTSVCLCGHVPPNDSRVIECDRIIRAAGDELKEIHSMQTGNLIVDDSGNVLLEITSPNITAIVEKMEKQLKAAGALPANKSNPVHIIIRKGVWGKPVSEADGQEIRKIMSDVNVLSLCNRIFSLEGAQFGTLTFSENSSNITSLIQQLTAPQPTKSTVTVIQALNKLRKSMKITLSAEEMRNLADIVTHCNHQYSNSMHYGNAVLNRMILRDSYIADRLTPEVLQFIFTCPDEELFVLSRDNMTTNLKEVITRGFGEGLPSIHWIPESIFSYGVMEFVKQGADFLQNTLKIVKNIETATHETIKEEIDLSNISSRFDQIVREIDEVKRKGASAQLLHNLHYKVDAIRKQVHSGFESAIKLIEIKISNGPTGPIVEGVNNLDELADRLLSYEGPANEAIKTQVWIDGTVSHYFYDRLHLEAALEMQDYVFTIGDRAHTYRDLFQKLVEKIASIPDKFAEARRQLCLRFDLVEKHLRQLSNQQQPQAKQQAIGAAAAAAVPSLHHQGKNAFFMHGPLDIAIGYHQVESNPSATPK